MSKTESKNKPSSFDIEDESKEFRKNFDYQNGNSDLNNIIQKPTTLIIAILLCAILVLTLQFGNLQHKLDALSKELSKNEKKENAL